MNSGYRKRIFIGAIISNLLLLCYFKYTNFLLDNLTAMFEGAVQLEDQILPLAISFFTFQQIAYLADCYKQKSSENNFANYLLFISFFPQLIAGPIVHHKEMMPQFRSNTILRINISNVIKGLFIFSIGLFKKVVIADTFAVWVESGYEQSDSLSLFHAWQTSLSYSFQLYFDFSGYCDMAIGLALLFNIVLPINFNSPYKALNIQDFWRRWHITLSRFLQDYVYIPLGGNRVNVARVQLNLMATFIVGGIWHGAGWTFVLFGFLHGAAIVIHRLWQYTGIRLYSWIGWLLTFNFVNIAWIFFKAESVTQAFNVVRAMFAMNDPGISLALRNKWLELQSVEMTGFLNNFQAEVFAPFYLLICFVVVIGFKNSNQLCVQHKANFKYLLTHILLFVLSIVFLSIDDYITFLYFDF